MTDLRLVRPPDDRLGAKTAARLAWARKQADLPQAKLAEIMQRHGVAVSEGGTISKYENWDPYRRPPPGDYLRVLAELARTTTDYLLGLTDDPHPFEREVDRKRLAMLREIMNSPSLDPDALVEAIQGIAGADVP